MGRGRPTQANNSVHFACVGRELVLREIDGVASHISLALSHTTV